MTAPSTRALALGMAALLVPALALAHPGADTGHVHGFAAGFAHPFTGLDHLAAMLAVGWWSGQTARRPWVAPLAFAALLLAGALLAQGGGAWSFVEPMVATSLLVIGLLLALRRTLPTAVGAALVGGFAIFHGAAHGVELSGGAALAGMVLATATLHTAGLALGRALRERSALLPRAAGAVIALFGLSLLC